MSLVVEVFGVQPTPREGRPAPKAWPSLALWLRLPVLGLLLGQGCVGWLVAFSMGERIGWIVALLFATLYGFMGLNALVYRRMTRLARIAPISRPPVDWRLSATGIVIGAEGFESRVDWRMVAAVVEEKDRLIFALTPNSNFVLPLRALDAGQAATVRDLVADARARGVLGAGVDSPSH